MSTIDETAVRSLVETARRAAQASYSPYSRFRVGAALLCGDGTVVTGTNVENRSYGLTVCAERAAVFAAVGRGKREFRALALCAPDAAEPVPPCGACRQVLSEFASPDLPVYYTRDGAAVVRRTLGELYPFDSLHELKQ
jgi:cytidine deaminase